MRSGPPALTIPLDAVRREFETWRRTHRARSRLPQRLWALAVTHARVAGVNATAQALRLNYYALKERMEDARGARAPGPLAAPTFVEVVPAGRPPAGVSECVIELGDARGATMRIALRSPGLPDLAALSRGFWRGRP